ncbi:MAG: hypothetical protein ACI9UK_001126, partial [Candidatus Krumholzibacteriia bacterium]
MCVKIRVFSGFGGYKAVSQMSSGLGKIIRLSVRHILLD